MSAVHFSAPVIASTLSTETLRHKKLHWSYLEVVNYHFKKLATDQAFIKIKPTILCYFQPASMTPMQYDDI